jgi:hypothetical protein
MDLLEDLLYLLGNFSCLKYLIILEPESGVTVVCAVFVASVMCKLLFAKYLQAFGAKNLSFVWYLHESHGGIMVVAFYSWNLSCA